MRRSPSRFVVLSLLTTLAIAQQRSPFFATVVGLDGKPLADAEVTCVFTPSLLLPGVRDVVAAKTDARGRARCDLQVGLLYVAWAIGPVDGATTRLVSEPVQLVAAGRVVQFAASAVHKPRPFRIAELAAWRTAGAANARWFPLAGHEHSVDLPFPPEDGTIALPPSPWATGCLALVDAAGELLAAVAVPADAAAPPEFALPAVCSLLVEDAAGARVADVTIEQMVTQPGQLPGLFGSTGNYQARLRRAAITDANGMASFSVPCGARPEPVIVRATKAGTNWRYDSVHPGAAAGTLKLVPATATRVRVVGTDAARTTLGAQSAFQVIVGNGMSFGQHPVAVDAIDPTHWLVHGPATGFTPRLYVPPRGIPTAAVFSFVPEVLADLTLDLDRLRAIDVRVTGADGGPPGCALAVARISDGHPVYWDHILAADTAGRAALLLPEGEFLVYATAGTSHALALVGAQSTEALAIRLEPIPVMRVWLLTPEGKPIVGARASFARSFGGRVTGDAIGQQWARVAFQMRMSYIALPRSDQDGRLDIPVFLPPGMEAKGIVRDGPLRSEEFVLDAAMERTVVVK